MTQDNTESDAIQKVTMQKFPDLLKSWSSEKSSLLLNTSGLIEADGLLPPSSKPQDEIMPIAKFFEEVLFDIEAVQILTMLNDRQRYQLSTQQEMRMMMMILMILQTEVVASGWLKTWNWALVIETVVQRNGNSNCIGN